MPLTHNVAGLTARVARLGDGLHAALGRDVALLTAVCTKSKSVFPLSELRSERQSLL